MTDHDTTIREAVQYRDTLTSDEVITVQIENIAKPLVPVDPDKLSGMLEALLAVIEQQQATIDRQAETLRQVREYALAHAESAGHPELGGAESQIGRDILRILDGEGA